MTNANPINSLFSGKRVYIIIGLFLIITGFLVYRGFSETQFIPSAENGSHIWIDSNADNKIQPNEMKSSNHGDYKIVSAKDAFSEIEFTLTTFIWILVAIIFVALRDFAYILRIRVFTDKYLNYKRSFVTIMLWEFASALSPGVVGGSAVALFILNKEGVGIAKSTAIVMLSTLMDNLFFVLMIPFVLLFISIDTMFGTETLWMTSFFWIGYTIITLVSVLLFTALIIYPKVIGATVVAFTRIKWFKKWQNHASTFSCDIVKSAHILKQKKFGFWIKTFGATILAWISRYLVVNALVMAFISLNALENIVLLGKQLILWLLMLVSPTPGATGIAEFAFSELLRPFTSSLLLLTCIALLWRLISYFPYLIIGALLLPKWLKLKK